MDSSRQGLNLLLAQNIKRHKKIYGSGLATAIVSVVVLCINFFITSNTVPDVSYHNSKLLLNLYDKCDCEFESYFKNNNSNFVLTCKCGINNTIETNNYINGINNTKEANNRTNADAKHFRDVVVGTNLTTSNTTIYCQQPEEYHYIIYNK